MLRTILSLLLCTALPALGADAPKPKALRITAKSFVKGIDFSSMTGDPRARAEQALGAAAGRKVAEDPSGPSADANDFRMWSEVTVTATCRGNSIASWKASPLVHRTGGELPMLDGATRVMEPLKVTATPARAKGEVASIKLSYAIKATPSEAALSSYRSVRPRACTSVWHRVHATINCRGGKLGLDGDIGGSRFPSHRIWTNGEAMATLDQGPLTGLWDCDPKRPELVR
jgi:hypothetical protein